MYYIIGERIGVKTDECVDTGENRALLKGGVIVDSNESF